MISRRKFLVGLGAISAVSLAYTVPLTHLFNGQSSWIVSGASDKKGNYFVAAFDLNGKIISKVSLPARAHQVLAIKSKPGYALVFARRPGEYILEIDFKHGQVTNHIEVAPEHRLYGHGILAQQDTVLVSSENDYQAGRGLIVLRERASNKILAQYDSGGIGPHEVALMPDKKHIVIANGGIQTHPEQGRKKLNLDSMKPNLAYMELSSGKIVDKFTLDNHHLSIRHLAVSDNGKVIAGMQYQGASTDEVPLAISHQGEEKLQYLKADSNTWRSMKQYTASVCINSKQNVVVITCPKASLLTYWQLNSNEFISSHKLKDGAGATLVDDHFVASTGRGRVITHQDPLSSYQLSQDFNDIRWDNHMTSIAMGS